MEGGVNYIRRNMWPSFCFTVGTDLDCPEAAVVQRGGQHRSARIPAGSPGRCQSRSHLSWEGSSYGAHWDRVLQYRCATGRLRCKPGPAHRFAVSSEGSQAGGGINKLATIIDRYRRLLKKATCDSA